MMKPGIVSPLSNVSDEGLFVLSTKDWNFTGTGVTVTSVAGKATVNVPGAVDTNNYVATFIVAPTSGGTGAAGRATHATLAAAVGAITGDTVIYLLEGTHAVAAKITLPTGTGNIALVGGGPASIIRLDAGVNDDAITSSGAGRLLLANFTLDGNKASQTSGRGFVVGAFTKLQIKNVTFTSCKDTGLYVASAASEDPLIDNVQSVSNDGYGFYTGTGGTSSVVVLTGCTAALNGLSGFFLNQNNSLSGCISRDNASAGFFGNNASNITFASCWGTGNAGSGFTLAGASSRHSVSGCYAAGNAGSGFAFSSSAFAISASYAELNSLSGFRISSNDGTVSGCTSRANSQNGVIVDTALDTVISGCDISGNGATFSGIVLQTGVTGCAVSGNRIIGQKYGIKEEGTADSNTFSNNIISGASTASYNILGASSKIQDPGVVTLTITRTAAAGTGAQVIDSAFSASVAQFKPTSIEFIGSDDGDQSVYSDGWSDSLINSCHDHNTLTDKADLANAINIQNMTPDGYTAVVSLLGKASGSAQEGFTLNWTVVGAGRAVSVKALLRR